MGPATVCDGALGCGVRGSPAAASTGARVEAGVAACATPGALRLQQYTTRATQELERVRNPLQGLGAAGAAGATGAAGAHLRQRAPLDKHEGGHLASATHGRRALQRLDTPLAVRVAPLRRVVRLIVSVVGVARLAVAARCRRCGAPSSDAAAGAARLLGGVGLPRRGGAALSRGGRRPRATAAAASAPHLGRAASTVARLLTAGLIGLRSVPILAGTALARPLGARGATSGAAVHLVRAVRLPEVTERVKAVGR
eukprot:scaffold10730_cov54-Phaeocystis_antarctica.AAC.2